MYANPNNYEVVKYCHRSADPLKVKILVNKYITKVKPFEQTVSSINPHYDTRIGMGNGKKKC